MHEFFAIHHTKNTNNNNSSCSKPALTHATATTLLARRHANINGGGVGDDNGNGRRNTNESRSWRGVVDGQRALHTLSKLDSIRPALNAPVDTYGPSVLADAAANEHDRRYQILISAMLSSQTRDLALGPVVQRLQQTGGLSITRILEEDEHSLAQLLQGVSFHRVKARNVLAATNTLAEKHGSRVPRSVDALLSIKGVGPKMAHLVMRAAFGDTTGIAVDTHVHRIANRLGWARTWHAKSNAQDKTRIELQELFPRQHWHTVNHALVAFGQTVCEARRPNCAQCPVVNACIAPQIGQQQQQGQPPPPSPPPSLSPREPLDRMVVVVIGGGGGGEDLVFGGGDHFAEHEFAVGGFSMLEHDVLQCAEHGVHALDAGVGEHGRHRHQRGAARMLVR
eukprot:CAMPEP_0185848088 /NCGR_PEP_ID=MMETSP1354-20130828/3094_1 /TAXON_ID=708628 /ORGANISM="Erythrolobus madagascarensis, Strain CCMP3276" /LENGTH=394 /DNA_ID=CAMNT_0028548439 /DNA_START=102 /DNA_END=1288 /DNA_ORIENTATION=+